MMLLAILLLFTRSRLSSAEYSFSLDVFCAAALKAPIEAAAKSYETLSGATINLIVGGSGTLLNNLQLSERGDLYIAADESYTELAQNYGLIEESCPLVELRAGLVVAKDNPYAIHQLEDVLAQPRLRIGLAHPDTASLGKFTQEQLMELGLWNALQGQAQRGGVFTSTANELTMNLSLGSIDTAIVWDAVAAQYPELIFIPIKEFNQTPKVASAGVLVSSRKKEQASRFIRYLQAEEVGLAHFSNLGYQLIGGVE